MPMNFDSFLLLSLSPFVSLLSRLVLQGSCSPSFLPFSFSGGTGTVVFCYSWLFTQCDELVFELLNR